MSKREELERLLAQSGPVKITRVPTGRRVYTEHEMRLIAHENDRKRELYVIDFMIRQEEAEKRLQKEGAK